MRILAKLLVVLILPIMLYLLVSAILMLFPANENLSARAEGVQEEQAEKEKQGNPAISLTHDLAHVNILIDLSQSSFEWQTLLPDLVPEKRGYLLVGWGDQATYLSTPYWSDLQASVAIKALLSNTPSALHLRYLADKNRLRVAITPLFIEKESVRLIEQKIKETFVSSRQSRTGIPQLLSPGYDDRDRFYYASGEYNLFNTCNTWIGDVLRESGVAISRWTPISYNVIYSIPAEVRGK